MVIRNVNKNSNVKYEKDDQIVLTSKPEVKLQSDQLITFPSN